MFGYDDGTVSLDIAAGNKGCLLKGLSNQKAWILLDEYLESGSIDSDEIQLKEAVEAVPTKKKTAEKWMRFFGIMGIFPGFSLLGIIPLFLSNKVKQNNNGVLPQTSKYDIILGLCGFAGWLLFSFVLLCVI